MGAYVINSRLSAPTDVDADGRELCRHSTKVKDNQSWLITTAGLITQDAYDLGRDLKAYAEELIEATSEQGLARDYALAFLSDVDWREIAKHLIVTLKEDA
jgi:hypothetical protein